MRKEATYSKVTFINYSEKAIKFALGVLFSNDNEKIYTFFAPKSLLKENQLPDWFINKKAEEIKARGVIGYSTVAYEEASDDEKHLCIGTIADFMVALQK